MRFFFRFLKLVCRLAFKPCLKTFFGNARPVGHALNDETISVFFAIKNPINILAWDTEQFCNFWDGDGLCFYFPVTLSISRSAVAAL